MKNGVYAAMKTDDGVQAVYFDEQAFLAEMEQMASERQERKEKAQRRKVAAKEDRQRRETIRLVKQELKLLAAGLVLYWGFCAGLVELAFAAPVLIGFQTVICFRAGRWFGRRERNRK